MEGKKSPERIKRGTTKVVGAVGTAAAGTAGTGVVEQSGSAMIPKSGGSGSRHRKERQGVVVKAKMSKTLVVAVSRLVKHPVYGKYLKRTKKYYVHDAESAGREGDLVNIVETKPTSKLKRWRLSEVVRRGEAA